MKHALRSAQAAFLLLFTIAVLGCAQLGLPTPTTMNEKIAAAQSSATQLRVTATQLLNAKTISSQDATNVLRTTDAATEGIAVALAMSASDPTGANTRLQTTITLLSTLQAYLATKKQ